ncbi:glycosyltransferase family 2 protein [Amphritea opalescens]|uniref:Glycosyltransferase family 2 protein n=1 Tax=Amphritea opalescens TaxID=2490544 RepID=A0A430KR25_9GAMM|nr:glycosyltransferase family 2 protein [Amphritea opalescens]RTE65957.1 glycosyltransferase family 2 protein [Amphritea opalescens]
MAESVLAESAFKPIVVIPVYNHEEAISVTLADVLRFGYPVLLVDDGSSAKCRDVLVGLRDQYAGRVSLMRLEQNGGKGAAVKAGLRQALEAGYSHAVQVDADGQHDLDDIPLFMEVAYSSPEALVIGYPRYDESVPTHRYLARYLTHIWVWINTLSFLVKDTMCGFRVYPLTQVVSLLQEDCCGDRMEFDTEVVVRWVWRGLAVENLPTKVHYPIDGVSHFNAVKDNVLISRMHAKLFFGMLLRLPRLMRKKLNV